MGEWFWKRFGLIKMFSIYSYFILHWLKYFPLEQFLFLDGEKILKEPYTCMEQAQEFMNMPKVLGKDDFYINDEVCSCRHLTSFSNVPIRLDFTAPLFRAQTRTRQSAYLSTRDVRETLRMMTIYTYLMPHSHCLKTSTARSMHNCAKFYPRSFRSSKTYAKPLATVLGYLNLLNFISIENGICNCVVILCCKADFKTMSISLI